MSGEAEKKERMWVRKGRKVDWNLRYCKERGVGESGIHDQYNAKGGFHGCKFVKFESPKTIKYSTYAKVKYSSMRLKYLKQRDQQKESAKEVRAQRQAGFKIRNTVHRVGVQQSKG